MEESTPNSTNIARLQWYPGDELVVFFKNGSVYKYLKVPYHVYHDLTNAQSVGSFFAANVRNKYNYEMLEGPKK